MNIVQTITTKTPSIAAQKFGAILSVDIGVCNKIVKVRGGYAVVADDAKAVVFKYDDIK